MMAYDEHRNQVVMYDSLVEGRPALGATWTWNGSDWTEANHTGEFAAQALVYDGKLGSVVAFSFTQMTPQSRQWNGSTWSDPVNGGPTPRRGASVAYDPVSGNVVVFGGRNQQNPFLDDTWTWDGSQWTEQHPAASPTPRYLAVMAYDPNARKVLLFGGSTARADFSTETWSWDGSTWTQLSPIARPPAASYLPATDPGTGSILLIGQTPIMSPPPAFGSPPPYHWEQWRWTGTTWQAQVAGAHPDRLPRAIAYDKNNRNTVAVIANGAGGPVTTWILG